METMPVTTHTLNSMQDMLELAAAKLRAIRLADLPVETYASVLDARLEVAGVIGMLRHFTKQEEAV